jgi:hypothetical protein
MKAEKSATGAAACGDHGCDGGESSEEVARDLPMLAVVVKEEDGMAGLPSSGIPMFGPRAPVTEPRISCRVGGATGVPPG